MGKNENWPWDKFLRGVNPKWAIENWKIGYGNRIRVWRTYGWVGGTTVTAAPKAAGAEGNSFGRDVRRQRGDGGTGLMGIEKKGRTYHETYVPSRRHLRKK